MFFLSSGINLIDEILKARFNKIKVLKVKINKSNFTVVVVDVFKFHRPVSKG